MTLKIIGSGFGRTGTMTMKTALEGLGLGPCHHMIEIMQHPEQLAHWKALSAGRDVDLRNVFAGYVSQVDRPGAHIFAESAAAFPDARVIHTERPADDWWRSFNGTIGKFFRLYQQFELPPHSRDLFDTMSGYFVKADFPDLTDRESVIAAYEHHNARVREVIAPDRLLVFNVAEGWAPLCGFLGVPVPDTPFPHTHPRQEFWAHFGGEPAEDQPAT